MNIYNVATAVIFDGVDRFLLTQRYDPQNRLIHMHWQLAGGRIEDNETAPNACIREVYEETGLKVQLITNTPVCIDQHYPDVSFKLYGFLAKCVSGTINTENDEETHTARWFTLDEIKKLKTLENTIQMIEGCLQQWKNS